MLYCNFAAINTRNRSVYYCTEKGAVIVLCRLKSTVWEKTGTYFSMLGHNYIVLWCDKRYVDMLGCVGNSNMIALKNDRNIIHAKT